LGELGEAGRVFGGGGPRLAESLGALGEERRILGGVGRGWPGPWGVERG